MYDKHSDTYIVNNDQTFTEIPSNPAEGVYEVSHDMCTTVSSTTHIVNMMTPRLQMSTLLVYGSRKIRTSGAEYAHVPHTVDMCVWFTSSFARPKSASCKGYTHIRAHTHIYAYIHAYTHTCTHINTSYALTHIHALVNTCTDMRTKQTQAFT
jgi:hypothetical protein